MVRLFDLGEAGNGPSLLLQKIGHAFGGLPCVTRQTLDQNCCLHVEQSGTAQGQSADLLERRPGQAQMLRANTTEVDGGFGFFAFALDVDDDSVPEAWVLDPITDA